jgi:predicted nucleic acid-binding protein
LKNDDVTVLDACVLLPMPLADTLLRLAESPALYVPRWSQETVAEVRRNLIAKFGKTETQAARREAALMNAFPEACVMGYEELAAEMPTHPEDRHVAAAAVRCSASLLVTYNRRHFPPEPLKRLGIEVIGPSTFLQRLYALDPTAFRRKLDDQAERTDRSVAQILRSLNTTVPEFAEHFCRDQKINLF